MNIILSEILKDPEHFDELVLKHWSTVVLGAVKEVQTLVNRRRKTEMKTMDIPLPQKETEPAQLNSHFVPYGMCAGGHWMAHAASDDKYRTVYIHWPRILGTLPQYPSFPHVPLINTLLMVWGFSEIFRRRNVVYYEFFKRRLLHAMAAGTNVEGFSKKIPPLNPEENRVLGELSAQLLQSTDPMVAALRRSFSKTMEKASSILNVRNPREDFEHVLPVVTSACSPWHTQVTKRRAAHVFDLIPEPIIETPKDALFAPRHKQPWLNELIFARALPANNNVIFGAKRCLKVSPTQRITLVNMAEFADYRTRSGVKFYEDYRRKRNKDRVEWKDLAIELVFYFQSKLRSLQAPGGDYEPYYAFIEHTYPSSSLDHILFIPYRAVKEKYEDYNKIKPMLETNTYGLRKRGPIHAAVIESPPIHTANHQVFRFHLLLRRNRTYFYPPWDIAPVDIMAPVSQRREYKPGICFDRVNNYPYCTHKFLLSLPDSPLRMHPQLNEWLKQYVNITSPRYKELLEQSKRMYVRANYRKAGHRAPYTQEEDLIITKLYRTGMTESDKLEILEVCKGRNWEAIRTRASTICKRMLEYGCSDINELPTKNYNAALRRKIQANKEKENAR